MNPMRRIHDLPGVLVRDIGRYRRALAHSGAGFRSDARGWISLSNRIEHLVAEEGLPGYRCDWIWGSTLHAPGVLPSLATSLMQVALSEWPIEFANEPRVVAETPKISFIFAHSGRDRLPQLIRTIRSLYAQREVPCEVIVVDQSPTPLLGALPVPLTYRHLAKAAGAPEWQKTLAYNIGAQVAKGSILVFHDGDVCVPTDYARELVACIDGRGFAAASLQRFLFYLNPSDTQRCEAVDGFTGRCIPGSIAQNWKGGTIAITRDGFQAIGGFDERFTGWTGEDVEFFDRCLALRHCHNGYLPFVHLWHPPQPSKSGSQRERNLAFFQDVMDEPRAQRIHRLRQAP